MNFANTARKSVSTADVRLGSYAELAAEYYDSARHPTCANFREASALFLAEELSAFNLNTWLVTEIGAGRSLVAELMPPAVLARRRLVLIDASSEMLAHSTQWLAAGALGIVADARRLPVRDGCFSAVVVALGDAFNDQEFWHEVARVLRPGGLCLFTAPAFAWAQVFRSSVGARMEWAEFLTGDGKTLALPSIILPPNQQQEMIESTGLVVVRQRTITLREIVRTPWSSKLLPSRGTNAAVVDAFVVESRAKPA